MQIKTVTLSFCCFTSFSATLVYLSCLVVMFLFIKRFWEIAHLPLP